MKAEIATWIWILGLTTMGMMVFAIGMSIGGNQLSDTQRYMAVQEFSELVAKTKMVCQGGVENIYPHKCSFPDDIKAIYSSDISGPPPDKVSVMIKKEKRSEGKFLCIQFYGDEPYCEELRCDVNMSYLGTPSLEQDLFSRVNQIIGGDVVHAYEMVIIKTGDDVVSINSEKIISLKEDSPCGNGNVDIGEECDSLPSTCEPIYGSCSYMKCENCMCVVKKRCSYCAIPGEPMGVMGSDWSKYCLESSETICDDSMDNDRDGCIDDEDSGCGAVETNCSDGIDNDCDGDVDSADSNCP